LNEILQELEALKSELEDSLDTTAAVQDMRQKREVEVGELKKRLEDESKQHEAQVQEIRHKHAQQVDQINEQMDQIKKVCTVYERTWQVLIVFHVYVDCLSCGC
jgi:myosin heavy chain 9/10/11/14